MKEFFKFINCIKNIQVYTTLRILQIPIQYTKYYCDKRFDLQVLFNVDEESSIRYILERMVKVVTQIISKIV